MKLDTNPEHYKYLDLQAVCDTVDEMKNKTTRQLVDLGEALEVVVSSTRDAFETVNYEDAKSHIAHFKATTQNLQNELSELLGSAIELSDLMGMKWKKHS